jgi:hypothetical protein
MSFYDPIRPRQHIWRNRQADLLSRFQIDDELKLHRLRDGQISRFRAFFPQLYPLGSPR